MALALALLPGLADAASLPIYLVEPDQPTAISRSQQECQLQHCDGKQTMAWWNVIVNKQTGQAAVEIDTGTPYDATGLSASEQMQALPAAQLPLSWFPPSPLIGVIITTPSVSAGAQ